MYFLFNKNNNRHLKTTTNVYLYGTYVQTRTLNHFNLMSMRRDKQYAKGEVSVGSSEVNEPIHDYSNA